MARTEAREVWPYLHSRSAFDEVALRLDGEQGFQPTQSTFVLDPEVDQGPLTLEIRFDFDAVAVLSDVRLEASDVDVVVTLEHSLARLVNVLQRWPLEGVPSRYEFTIGGEDYSGGELSVRVAAVLNRSLQRTAIRRAWRAGSLLAERTFSIHLPRTPSLFNVENTSFSERNWDRHALWYVHFRDVSAATDSPPEDVVEVHLNKDLPALQFVWAASATRRGAAIRVGVNMVRQLIASEILAEIAIAVLSELHGARKDDPALAPAERSLAAVVIAALDPLGLPTEGLLDLAVKNSGELRRSIQNMMNVGGSFGSQAYRDWIQNLGGGAGS